MQVHPVSMALWGFMLSWNITPALQQFVNYLAYCFLLTSGCIIQRSAFSHFSLCRYQFSDFGLVCCIVTSALNDFKLRYSFDVVLLLFSVRVRVILFKFSTSQDRNHQHKILWTVRLYLKVSFPFVNQNAREIYYDSNNNNILLLIFI